MYVKNNYKISYFILIIITIEKKKKHFQYGIMMVMESKM